MPKYWVKNYFAHGRFPEVGQKQKTEGKKRRERLNDGNNNGQATHGARKPPGPINHPSHFHYEAIKQNKMHAEREREDSFTD